MAMAIARARTLQIRTIDLLYSTCRAGRSSGGNWQELRKYIIAKCLATVPVWIGFGKDWYGWYSTLDASPSLVGQENLDLISPKIRLSALGSSRRFSTASLGEAARWCWRTG